MKTSKLLTAVLLTSLLAQPLTALAGGDAVGYNGPDTAGKSVPVQLDRAITLEKVMTASNKCYGVILKDFYRKLNPTEPTPVDFVNLQDVYKLIFGNQLNGAVMSTFRINNIEKEKVSYQIWFNNTSDFINKKANRFNTAYMHSEKPDADILLSANLPLFNFNLTNNGSYDEYGRPLYGQAVVTNLVLYKDNLSRAWTNVNTGAETKLKIDQVGLIRCLLTEVQK